MEFGGLPTFIANFSSCSAEIKIYTLRVSMTDCGPLNRLRYTLKIEPPSLPSVVINFSLLDNGESKVSCTLMSRLLFAPNNISR